MAFALETLIVPVLLVTIIAVILLATDTTMGAAIATVVALGVLYFVFVRALRLARREEDEPGEDQSTRD